MIILVNFLLIAAFLSRFYFDKTLSDLNENIKIKNEILKQNASFEKEYVGIQKRIVAVRTLTNEISVVPELSKIISSIPTGIVFTNLNYSARDLTFQAQISNQEQYRLLLVNLKSLDFVKNVSVSSVEKTSGNEKSMQAIFKISLI